MDNLTIIDSTSLMWSAVTTLGEDVDNYGLAKANFNEWFEYILIATKADYYLAFTDKGSFRKDLIKSYKADRKAKRPKFLSPLKTEVSEIWNIESHDKLESDDLCLINYNYYYSDYNITIASIDSDLRIIPAKFYNFKKNTVKPVWETINSDEAEYNLWFKILSGSHNGLSGLTGCGPAKAKAYLSKMTIKQYPYAVLSAYINGISKELYGIKVNGFGILKGIVEFHNNFLSCYLLRDEKDVSYITDTESIFSPIKYKKNEVNEW